MAKPSKPHFFSKSHPHHDNTIPRIIFKNAFTLFNLVNVILAVMVALVGSYKNMLFIFIAIANTLISIINEIRAKKIVDKMRLIAEQKPTVIRDGKTYQIDPKEVEKGDTLILSLGDQVLFDSTISSGDIEVNESFITGEAENIAKHIGDELISGSFVVSGSARVIVKNIGGDNFVNKLMTEAHRIKTADSKLFKLMNSIVKYISYTLIPIGALLLWSRFRTEPDTTSAVTSTVAGLINMIPEGLILLTSSVLALATIRLSRQKVLVQDLYSIETLARVDCICLDKTGTLTTGNMVVKDYTELKKPFLSTLTAILSHQTSENATTKALRQKFLKTAKFEATANLSQNTQKIEVIPFSSDRKYSGFRKGNTEYLLGAIEFMTKDKDIIKTIKTASSGYRTLAVVKNNTLSSSTELLGYVRLADEIRHDAPEIIKYFYDNDIAVKIISGDDLSAVTDIASAVGIKDLKGVDLSTTTTHNYANLVKEYSIFTRVKPSEKKHLIRAFKNQGYTVAMTGDGVNDILAMKEADVSLSIGEGSDAARRASKLVLLNSDFSAVPSIIDEGRQSINNLERSTSLFLAKTVYASLLAILFVFLPLSYPYSPIEMSLLNFACIGFPGLILALEKNTSRIKNRFATNIIEYSLPIGLTVTCSALALSIIAEILNFSRPELTTISVITTFAIDIILIYWISRPLNVLRSGLLALIIAIFVSALLIPSFKNFFEFVTLSTPCLIVTASVIIISIILFTIIRILLTRLRPRILAKFHI